SKTPQSGEYLAKGAFVIRGKRNYFEKLEIKLAIGIRKDTDEPIVMCGPVRAVEKNCKDIIEIEPGDISKEKVAKDLSERYSVGIEDIQSVLPPGGVKITEKK
ncbi:MAG: fibronectin-binding domain-containing protein, partial [Thermoplasmata archaeon]|nr:fibronectin-binding domain-containing protein [Thermoplasmata archaeon]